jgi:2-polyprenyl-6-hydroxyphenyl methylase/3-demethylubiquinone-9 3-methyltransferase
LASEGALAWLRGEVDLMRVRLETLETKPPPDVPAWEDIETLLSRIERVEELRTRIDALESKPPPDVPSWHDVRILHSELESVQAQIAVLEATLSSVASAQKKKPSDVRESLERIPSLRNSPPKAVPCKICDGKADFFDIVDFNKYCGQQEAFLSDISGVEVPYYRCELCEFTFTDLCDEWTAEDFRKFIYNDEYEIVDPEYKTIRPAYTADNMAKILEGCEEISIIDYGSGSGQFAQEMRSRGFSVVSSYDPFSSPEMPSGRFDVACLFEVIEHMPDPMKTLRNIVSEILEPSGIIILTQSIQPVDFKETRGRWWYIGPRNGHISTYSEKTFQRICESLDLVCFNLRPGYYAFRRRNAIYEGPLRDFIERHFSRPIACPT